ncbi:histone-lysine N-methyltransferase SETMAR [Trichonephila clavipes]|nr:histone-lysine N-methyltransferase SETMAR [Trichonephila clavipes]
MDTNEYRVGIKYLFLKDNTRTKIKYELDSVYGDSAPLFTTAKIWAAQFKRGRKSLVDIERSKRPNTPTTDENIANVHQMMLDVCRIKVTDIAEVRNASKEYVCHILNQHLSMRKLSARWEPRLLTLAEKRVRMNISNTLLAQFRAINPSFGAD